MYKNKLMFYKIMGYYFFVLTGALVIAALILSIVFAARADYINIVFTVLSIPFGCPILVAFALLFLDKSKEDK